MNIKIHRGQNQIGGSIIEISTETTRLIFDIGINLDESENTEIPEIDGLFSGEKSCDAVFISHYHSDHIGLIDDISKNIQVYMGERSYKMYKVSCDYREKRFNLNPKFCYDKTVIEIGDVKITPFLCDHSSFDSYMFLVNAGGKSVLYTGDYRANGRKDFENLLKSLPEVDAIITEGTTLNRQENRDNIKEDFLEDIAINYIKEKTGPVFILMSAMNIDRLITAYEIAKNTDRVFLEDIYTAEIATASGEKHLFPEKKNGVRVFVTGGDKQFEILQKYGNAKIGKTGISKSRFVMCTRSSMLNYLKKLSEIMSFENSVLFYGMWKGYLEQPQMKEFVDFMESKGVKLHILHTSGHADAKTIDKLIEKTNPKIIIPVHTENAEWFNRYSDKKEIVFENKIVEL